jgi:hypothetical protein
MRKHLIFNAVLVGFFLAATAQAQPSRQLVIEKKDAAEASPAGTQQPFFDDDGGRVFIVRRNAGPLGSLRYHGGEVIAQPQQYNIFLGNAWSDTALRQREAAFSNLLLQANKGEEQVSYDSYGVRNVFWPSENQERPFAFSSDQTISDLGIQNALQEMLKAGDIQRTGPNTIYVVFLPPDISSRLGSMIGGKHFAAYHNFFHADQGKVHYVVVPFEPDVNLSKQVAARAVIDTALNPTGDGWY